MPLRLFAREAFAAFRSTAAIAPSSRHLTRAMLQPLALAKAAAVVEFGSGTGAITRAMLDMIPPTARLFAFEINPRFVEYLRRTIADSRLVLSPVSARSAARQLHQLGCDRVDAVVSSVPLGYMSVCHRHELLENLQPLLASDAVLTQFQYLHGLQHQHGRFCRFDPAVLLRHYFATVRRRIVWMNLPPAYVFECHHHLGYPG